jgi:unsaturated rhamnogalacturonyl hydrolase
MNMSPLTFVVFASLLSTPALALTPASPGATPLEWSMRMADSDMARLGDTLCAPPVGNQKWNYTTGLYADALVRLSEQTHQPAYTESAEKIIGSFLSPDGKIATFSVAGADSAPSANATSDNAAMDPYYSLDDIQSGVVTLKLYDITGDERYHKAADFMRDQLKQHPRTSEGGFWHKGRYPFQMWLDGLYMGEPFYAGYAKRFNEPADFDDIANQFRLITLHTYDPATGLLYHGWDEKKVQPWANKETGTSPSFWSRAIGWYAMALVDVLDDMPADHPARAALIEDLNKVAKGILKFQDPKTGVWWQVTDQGPRKDNYLEASASSMFVYALAKGVNHGYLPRTDLPAIHAGYQGLIQTFITTDPDGKTINLNQCCKVATLSKKALGTFEYYTKGAPIVPNDLKGVGSFIDAGIECTTLFGTETFAPAPGK